MKMVLVQWVDSDSYEGHWQSKDAVERFAAGKLMTVQSVGFVTGDNKKALTLTQSITDHQSGHNLRIPKCAVQWMRELKQVKKGT